MGPHAAHADSASPVLSPGLSSHARGAAFECVERKISDFLRSERTRSGGFNQAELEHTSGGEVADELTLSPILTSLVDFGDDFGVTGLTPEAGGIGMDSLDGELRGPLSPLLFDGVNATSVHPEVGSRQSGHDLDHLDLHPEVVAAGGFGLSDELMHVEVEVEVDAVVPADAALGLPLPEAPTATVPRQWADHTAMDRMDPEETETEMETGTGMGAKAGPQPQLQLPAFPKTRKRRKQVRVPEAQRDQRYKEYRAKNTAKAKAIRDRKRQEKERKRERLQAALARSTELQMEADRLGLVLARLQASAAARGVTVPM